MILQALTSYYESLVDQGKLARPGWSKSKISIALYLSSSGKVEQAVSLKQEVERGKKKVLVPQELLLPAPVKRASGISSNFLWDNSSYILGFDNKGKPQRSIDCFTHCQQLHQKLLQQVDSPAAKALLAFFEHWDPTQATSHPALQNCMEELLAGGNIVFLFDGQYIQQDPEIQKAWQTHYDAGGDGPSMTCLVTGKEGPVEKIHPSIKGVPGAQAVGAALVSFNAPAFCSYGKEQNFNAPTSKYAAFAYTSALNYLLAHKNPFSKVGDTTIVFWAKSGAEEYSSFFGDMLFGGPSYYKENELQAMMNVLCQGQPALYDECLLDPQMDFYILGLSPNAARLSVRFFLHNTFGGFLKNIQAHHQRMEIQRPAYDKFETLPLWKLMSETVNQNSKDKEPAPQLAGETLRAILNNTRYPAQLLHGITLRIRAEHQVTRGRAAILKGYYLKNPHPDVPKEVLTVSLNPASTNIPYTLGRLFSVLESIQSAANPGINATIKDKYFNSASATPSHVFPVLINLAQKHLKKLDGGLRIFYEKQLTDLISVLGEEYPAHMNLPQQGAFQLGYYHQTQKRYQKKEEN